MEVFELVQKHYFHENERRSDLNRSLAVPLALTTALLTGILTFLREITPPFWWGEIALFSGCAPAVMAGLIAISELVRASVGYTYDHPCDAGTLLDWRAGHIAAGSSEWAADRLVRAFMLTEYAECARVNAANNDKKSAHMHNANVQIVVALAFLIIAATPYLIVRAEKSEGQSGNQVASSELQR
jgi:hypothetical protein